MSKKLAIMIGCIGGAIALNQSTRASNEEDPDTQRPAYVVYEIKKRPDCMRASTDVSYRCVVEYRQVTEYTRTTEYAVTRSDSTEPHIRYAYINR